MENNQIELIGKVVRNFEYEYSSVYEDFYSLIVEISRVSGNVDTLVLMCSDAMFNVDMNILNEIVSVTGSIRTYNDKSGDKNHLKISVFVEDLELLDIDGDIVGENNANVIGYICKKNPSRLTPLGRKITDIVVAVHHYNGKSYYIPCIGWGRNATYLDNLEIGTKVNLCGRLQSREYIKENETKIAYEFSIQSIDVVE